MSFGEMPEHLIKTDERLRYLRTYKPKFQNDVVNFTSANATRSLGQIINFEFDDSKFCFIRVYDITVSVSYVL